MKIFEKSNNQKVREIESDIEFKVCSLGEEAAVPPVDEEDEGDANC